MVPVSITPPGLLVQSTGDRADTQGGQPSALSTAFARVQQRNSAGGPLAGKFPALLAHRCGTALLAAVPAQRTRGRLVVKSQALDVRAVHPSRCGYSVSMSLARADARDARVIGSIARVVAVDGLTGSSVSRTTGVVGGRTSCSAARACVCAGGRQ